MGWLWSLVVIVGPILLIGALIYAFLRNRAGSRRGIARAERGSVELREELKRDPEYREE